MAAGPLPASTSDSPWMPTRLGHTASGLGPACKMEISTQARLQSPRVQFPTLAKICVMMTLSWGRGFHAPGRDHVASPQPALLCLYLGSKEAC